MLWSSSSINCDVGLLFLFRYRDDKGLMSGNRRRGGRPASNQRGPAPARFGNKNNEKDPNNKGPNTRGSGNNTNNKGNHKTNNARVIKSNKFDKTLNNYVAQNFKTKNNENTKKNNNSKLGNNNKPSKNNNKTPNK